MKAEHQEQLENTSTDELNAAAQVQYKMFTTADQAQDNLSNSIEQDESSEAKEDAKRKGISNCSGSENDPFTHVKIDIVKKRKQAFKAPASGSFTQSSQVNQSGKRLWYHGAQVVSQKETVVLDEKSDEEWTLNESETSFSLIDYTPSASKTKEIFNNFQRKKPLSFSPLSQVDESSLIRIDELEEHDEDTIRVVCNGEQVPGISLESIEMPALLKATTEKLMLQAKELRKDTIKLSKYEKKAKTKQIKKVLKERLNIDCWKMLGEDSSAEDDDIDREKKQGQGTPGPASDSYRVLMREIGIDLNVNDGLSAAFVEKNGEAERQDLRSFIELFSVRDLLGNGAFGVVLSVKNRKTKEKSAVKIIAKERLSAHAQNILKNESTIMQTMKHPNIISLKRIYENQKFITLEMELILGGQLKKFFKLKDNNGQPRPLSDLQASKAMKSLLEGVAYVHARDIVHRDLKPENILLANDDENDPQVKIVDFGLSAEQNFRNPQNEKAGTLIYMAPEQVTKKNYSKKVDLWACGIIAYQLLSCGLHPCYEPGEKDYCKKLANIENQPIEWSFGDNFSPLARDFFFNLCSYPPSQRYDAATALMHPWITRRSNDKIPLSQQQTMAMFEQERQLRKVMRLVYFASLVKMNKQPKSSGFTQDCFIDSDIPRQRLYTAVAIKNKDTTKVHNEIVPKSKNQDGLTLLTEDSDGSASPKTRFMSRQIKPKTLMSGCSVESRSGTLFTAGSFAAYKDFILQDRHVNSRKSMQNYTSTESKPQNGYDKQGKNQLLIEEEAKEDYWPVSKKISPPKKSKLRKKAIKPSLTLSPQRILASDPATIPQPQYVKQAGLGKTKPSEDALLKFAYSRGSTAYLIDGQQSIVSKDGDSLERQPQRCSQLIKSPLNKQDSSTTDQNHLKGDFVNGRHGRNLVNFRSPEMTLTDTTTELYLAGAGRSQIKQYICKSACRKDAQNFGAVDVFQCNSGHQQSFRDSGPVTKQQLMKIQIAQPESISSSSNVLNSAIQSVSLPLSAKQADQRLKSHNATTVELQPSMLSYIDQQFLVKHAKKSVTQMLESVQNCTQVIDIPSVSEAMDQVLSVCSQPSFGKASEVPSQQIITTPTKNVTNDQGRRVGRQFKISQFKSPRFDVNSMREGNQKNSNIDSNEYDVKGMMAKQSVATTVNSDSIAINGSEQDCPLHKKKSKKWASSKRTNLSSQQFSQNNQRGNNQTAISFEGTAAQAINPQYSKQSDHKMPKLINWFQMIQAEKTVKGSKMLQQHLIRGSPIIEAKDESMQSSIEPSILISDYYERQKLLANAQPQQIFSNVETTSSKNFATARAQKQKHNLIALKNAMPGSNGNQGMEISTTPKSSSQQTNSIKTPQHLPTQQVKKQSGAQHLITRKQKSKTTNKKAFDIGDPDTENILKRKKSLHKLFNPTSEQRTFVNKMAITSREEEDLNQDDLVEEIMGAYKTVSRTAQTKSPNLVKALPQYLPTAMKSMIDVKSVAMAHGQITAKKLMQSVSQESLMTMEHHTPLEKNPVAALKRTGSKAALPQNFGSILPNRLSALPGRKASSKIISQSQTSSSMKLSLPACVNREPQPRASKKEIKAKRNKIKNSKSSHSSIKVPTPLEATSEFAGMAAQNTTSNLQLASKMGMNYNPEKPPMGNGLLTHHQKVLISASTETAQALLSPPYRQSNQRLFKCDRPGSKRNPNKSVSKPQPDAKTPKGGESNNSQRTNFSNKPRQKLQLQQYEQQFHKGRSQRQKTAPGSVSKCNFGSMHVAFILPPEATQYRNYGVQEQRHVYYPAPVTNHQLANSSQLSVQRHQSHSKSNTVKSLPRGKKKEHSSFAIKGMQLGGGIVTPSLQTTLDRSAA